MPTYGMSSSGFLRKTLAVCRDELEAALKAAFGNDIKFEDSVWQVLSGILAEREADVWELAEAVYNAMYPSTAEGASLAMSVSLTGHQPLEAQKSSIVGALLTGDPLTVIPQGSVASVPATGVRFATTAEVTLDGDGEATVDLEAEEFGPLEAPIETLTQIDTPIAGWDTISNPAAAELGRLDETDAALRARRESEISNARASQESAIRAAILEVFGVTDCSVTSNVMDETVSGRPPHSFEAVVIGGDDDDIRAAIWSVKPSGIQSFGTEEGFITDDEGNSQQVSFSRGVEVRVYVSVTLVRNSLYPSDGDTRVKAAIVAYGETLRAGDDVKNFLLSDALSSDAGLLSGVDSVDVYQAKTASPATKTTIQIAPNEIATIDTADIIVT